MNHARIESSLRLRRLGAALSVGGWLTTRDIVRKARVMAVSAAVAELRANGWSVQCRRRNGRDVVYEYRAVKIPPRHRDLIQ